MSSTPTPHDRSTVWLNCGPMTGLQCDWTVVPWRVYSVTDLWSHDRSTVWLNCGPMTGLQCDWTVVPWQIYSMTELWSHDRSAVWLNCGPITDLQYDWTIVMMWILISIMNVSHLLTWLFLLLYNDKMHRNHRAHQMHKYRVLKLPTKWAKTLDLKLKTQCLLTWWSSVWKTGDRTGQSVPVPCKSALTWNQTSKQAGQSGS